MFWKGRESFTVNAAVTAEKPVIVKTAAKATYSEKKSNQVDIASDANGHVGIVQFDSANNSIEFDVLLNAKADPNHVYIGSRLENPKQLPFTLSTRGTLFGTQIRRVKSTRNQELTGIYGLKGNLHFDSKKRPIPVAPSHRSGGGRKNERTPE
jgi:hypothetical protein